MIKTRAAELQKKVELEDNTMRSAARGAMGAGQADYGGGKSVYDFDVMISGKALPFSEAVGVTRGTKKGTKKVVKDQVSEDGEVIKVETTEEVDEEYDVRPGAILLVNIKQDDPIARRNIPQLIDLAGRYGVKVRLDGEKEDWTAKAA